MTALKRLTIPLAPAVLAASLASPVTAFAHACGNDAISETLQELFNYSQLAERPEDRRSDETTTCSFGTPNERATPDDLTPITITDKDAQRLKDRLPDNLAMRPFVERFDVNVDDDALYIGCEVPGEPDIAVEMRLYRRSSQGDLIRLDVVGRHPNVEDRSWTPLEVRDNAVVLPGTRWIWKWTARANFDGEHCAFPLARFVVHALCENANDNPDGPNHRSLLTPGPAPTLVGHSLGATTAQFIMSTRGPNHLPECPGINAYAFSALGLDPNIVDQNRAATAELKSYLSECDFKAQLPNFHEQVQPGRLYTLSESNSHYLDEVQGDLCRCLQGGTQPDSQQYSQHRTPQHLTDRSQPKNAPSNRSLCPQVEGPSA